MQVSRRHMLFGSLAAGASTMVFGQAWAMKADRAALKVQDFYEVLLDATFDDFKGEKFTVDGDALPPGGHRLVRTKFHPAGAPVEINDLMRGKGEASKVVDIYLNGNISQLATWRSEYGSTMGSTGYQEVIDAVQRQTDRYMRSF